MVFIRAVDEVHCALCTINKRTLASHLCCIGLFHCRSGWCSIATQTKGTFIRMCGRLYGPFKLILKHRCTLRKWLFEFMLFMLDPSGVIFSCVVKRLSFIVSSVLEDFVLKGYWLFFCLILYDYLVTYDSS